MRGRGHRRRFLHLLTPRRSFVTQPTARPSRMRRLAASRVRSPRSIDPSRENSDRVRWVSRRVCHASRARHSAITGRRRFPIRTTVICRELAASTFIDRGRGPLRCRAPWCSWASPNRTRRPGASRWTTARSAGTTTPNPTSAPREPRPTRPHTTAPTTSSGESPTDRARPCRTRGTSTSSAWVQARGITPRRRG